MHNDRQAGILGIGIYTPERKLTNRDLEKMVNTDDKWIVTRTGIRERRIAEPHQLTSEMATEAAKRAIADAGIKVDEIDLIIAATNTPDMLFPATACLVQNNIGARKVGAFDLQAGCTSFLYGMVIASQFIVSGFCNRILLIGAECMSRVVNWEDRNTCILFGDAAGAVIMGPVPDGYGILSSRIKSDGSGAHLLTLPGGMTQFPATKETLENKLHFLHMNGREVFKFAVRNIEECCLDVLDEAGLTRTDLDYLIPHQANLRIIETAAKRLNVPLDKVAVNVDRYGNTSSATLPLALYESLQEDKINDGQHIVMVSFGAGLTWGALVMKWYDYRNHN